MGKVVLVVEDEPLLRMLAADLVTEAGFEVLEAAQADEALGILETRDDIRVIITDVDMPKGSMDGLKLAASVKDRWPPIKIIVVSGQYSVSESQMPPGSVFFAKPYVPDAVIAQVREFAQAA